jgi:hypothetical protein
LISRLRRRMSDAGYANASRVFLAGHPSAQVTDQPMKVTPASSPIGEAMRGRLRGFLGRESEFLRVGR